MKLKCSWKSLLLIPVLILCLALPVSAATVIPADVTTASSGCTLLGVKGTYITQIDEALALINSYRKEACEEGVTNPSTGNPLTMDDYVEIKWSADLEYIARIRAAEASLTMAHTRTNGASCFAIASPNGVRSYGEVLAWNWSSTMLMGIQQWYSEKSDWVNNTGAVTGHYTQMIDPENLYVGLGTFCCENARYYNTTAGEFTSVSGLNETHGSAVSDCIQMLEISDSALTNTYELTLDETINVKGDSASIQMTTSAVYNYKMSGLLLEDCSLSSSNASVVSVTQAGVLHANGCGEATITGKDSLGHSAALTLTVNHISVTDPAVAATCTITGKTEGSHCSVCGEVITAQKTISATGHTVVKDAAVAATCTTAGKTEGSHCSVCGKVITAQKVISATGHKTVTDKAVAATVFKAGKTAGSHCSVCGEILTAQKKVAKLKPTIKLSAAKKTIKVKKSFTLTISKLANGDSVKSVKSASTKIAKVKKISGKKYKITGVKKGKVKITVTLKSGKKATCTVTVKK